MPSLTLCPGRGSPAIEFVQVDLGVPETDVLKIVGVADLHQQKVVGLGDLRHLGFADVPIVDVVVNLYAVHILFDDDVGRVVSRMAVDPENPTVVEE
jgi:hypothetical protein